MLLCFRCLPFTTILASNCCMGRKRPVWFPTVTATRKRVVTEAIISCTAESVDDTKLNVIIALLFQLIMSSSSTSHDQIQTYMLLIKKFLV